MDWSGVDYCDVFISCLHLADAFIQSDLQIRKMEAIKINKCDMQVLWQISVSLTVHIARFLLYNK